MLRSWALCFVFASLPTLVLSRVLGGQITLESPESEDALQAYVLNLPYGNYTGVLDTYNDVVVFSNIRYAAPPVGQLRWAKPQPPAPGMSRQGGTCHQACPDWLCPKNGTKDPEHLPPPHPRFPLVNPQQEDCLFLDVYVPRTAINNSLIAPLPVLFWIHGGGYVEGHKDAFNGTGLIRDSGNSIIYVATNYRLGAFGFLASSILQAGQGIPNAGFWDQRAALEWTRTYIHLLNGNPNTITVMGESAGGGSIEHHLTALDQRPVFTRAILQSPAFFPQWDNNQQITQFWDFAIQASCNVPNAVDCLRSRPGIVLALANNATVNPAPKGMFIYGPAVDNQVVPNMPGVRLLTGQFNKGIDILVGHTGNEGYVFTPPITTPAEFDAWVASTFKNSPPAFPSQVDAYYPPAPQPPRYTDEQGRLNQLASEAGVDCNALYLDNAYGPNVTFNYYFNASLAYHGFDLCWTFPTFQIIIEIFGIPIDICPEIRLGPNPDYWRKYLVAFTATGNPNFSGEPAFWTPFGPNGSAMYMQEFGQMRMVYDDKLPPLRCGFWERAPYCKTCGFRNWANELQ